MISVCDIQNWRAAMRNLRTICWRWMMFVLLGFCMYCTDSSLLLLPPKPPPEPDNKLAITGQVCTQNPENLVFPVRVIFLVDSSESMRVTDPADPITGTTGRQEAVQAAVEELLFEGGDVKVSVVRFSSETQPLTTELDGDPGSYFTDDLDMVLTNLPVLSETDRTTNYIQALSEAYAEIRHELTHAEQESLALSSYQVVLVSDGIPDVDSGDAANNSTQNVLDAVEAIMELGRLFHINRMSIHTALLSSGNVLVDEVAEDLLSAMADGGNGTFRSFASGGELNFLNLELTSLKRMFSLKTLVAQNTNATPKYAKVLSDSDGDGVDDITERLSGSNPYSPDSDGDGCRDGVEYRFRSSGMDPMDGGDCNCYIPDYCFDEDEDLQCDNGCTDADQDGLCDCIDVNADGICDPENYTDGDGDGLFDCEEIYTGTNRNGPDSDGDGLVDFLEFRFGTHPDVSDSSEDLDWDAVSNGEEVRTATDPLAEVRRGRGEQAYRYNIREVDSLEKQSCYEFTVSNITISEMIEPDATQTYTGPAGQGYTGRNRIYIFAGEVPFDDPKSYARFRVACVEASFHMEGNYKNPPSGQVNVGMDDFVLLNEFVPNLHCISPGGTR